MIISNSDELKSSFTMLRKGNFMRINRDDLNNSFKRILRVEKGQQKEAFFCSGYFLFFE